MDEIKSRTKKIIGLSSICQDGKHILIWDFDQIKYYDVCKALSKIQSIHGLGIIYIFKSKHGFNAMCLDKLDFKEAHNIKLYTRFSDYQHTRIGYYVGSWCLKIDDTKQFVAYMSYTDTWKNRIQSNAHKDFIAKQFKIDVFNGEFDTNTKVMFESYKQDVI